MKTFIVKSNFEREVKAIDKDDVYYQLFKDIEEDNSTPENELSESLIIQEKNEDTTPYNNKNKHFRDWTTAKLKKEAKNYYDLIYNVECFGTRDMRSYDAILEELEQRGIEPKQKSTLTF